MFTVRDKIVLVTGGTRGIGFGIAQEFAKQGVVLILIGRDKKKLKTCIGSLNNPTKHSFICADFSNPDNLEKSLSNYFKKQKPIVHILINNLR